MYSDTLEFGLRDYDGTWEKYHDYKRGVWNTFVEKKAEQIKAHFKALPKLIEEEFITGRYKDIECNPNNNHDIKFLKNHVNFVTYELNREFIKANRKRTNSNEMTCFAVKLYIDNYSKINNIMKKTFRKMAEGRIEDVVREGRIC